MRRRGSWQPAVTWQSVLALGWVSFAGWWAFERDERIPLLSLVNLGVHELGHLVGYIVPLIGPVATAAAGSPLQCLAPLVLAAYFLGWRRDRLAAAVCIAWGATNFGEAATYIADAPFEQLELIGGSHDWAFILGPDHLDRLDAASAIATKTRVVGVTLIAVAAGLCLWSLLAPGSAVDQETSAGRDVETGDGARFRV